MADPQEHAARDSRMAALFPPYTQACITLAFKIFADDDGSVPRSLARPPCAVATPSRMTAAQRKRAAEDSLEERTKKSRSCELPSDVTGAAAAATGYAAAAGASSTWLHGSAAVCSVTAGADERAAAVRDVSRMLNDLSLAFGVLLHHQYCLSTRVFNGVDALLSDALYSLAAERRTAAGGTGGVAFTVNALPVLAQYRHCINPCNPEGDSDSWSRVFPLSGAHMDAVLRAADQDPDLLSRAQLVADVATPLDEIDSRLRCPPTRALVDVPASALPAWLHALSDSKTPFYSVRSAAVDGARWHHARVEGSQSTGNESRADMQDSIYLHWAVVAQPIMP